MKYHLYQFDNHERPDGGEYVVQAWSNLDGWQNTRFCSPVRRIAEDLSRELLADKSRWINGEPTQVRIIDTQ